MFLFIFVSEFLKCQIFMYKYCYFIFMFKYCYFIPHASSTPFDLRKSNKEWWVCFKWVSVKIHMTNSYCFKLVTCYFMYHLNNCIFPKPDVLYFWGKTSKLDGVDCEFRVKRTWEMFKCCGEVKLKMIWEMFKCCGEVKLKMIWEMFKCCGEVKLKMIWEMFKCCGV